MIVCIYIKTGRPHDLLNFITTACTKATCMNECCSLANATVGVLTSASLRNPCSGARLGPGHGHVDQAWCEAGGSAAEQSRRRRLGLFDAVHRRRPHGSGRRAGLDELRGRRAGHDRASMATGHGRATPLLSKTVASSSTLKLVKRRYEYEGLPAGVKVTVVADRGFGDYR